MKGVSVISQKINSTSTINVGMLEAGYYLVSIRMDDSKIIKRIVVK
jgi:hypothetical protein